MSEIRVENIIGETGTDAVKFTKGINVTGVTTATTFSGSGASLTSLPAANLTGTLPAISGANLTGVDSGFDSTQVFTSVGSHTWTKPSGITKVKVTVTAGGGGGGSHNSDDAHGGGGAGGTAIETIDVSSVSSVSVTVGGGGAGSVGDSQAGGGTGGTSSFGSYCSATGGAPPANWGLGGVGGVGSGGDLNLRGGNGVCGNIDGYGSSEAGGTGGSSYWGGGPHGGTNWAARGALGAPGSGGAGSMASTNNSGTAGQAGVVLVEQYK